ncbi:hypothetical protein BDN70DRAFT_720775 [Pholiota conissans]|uniref:Uncharacterized protein n=1 Tax=Pholiota conissans TaxID=109636 RepID=A0A9P5YZZ3_9AGAR|nr:hypothetical protein BDN70DRAFT_720775 [Pholiota conissans]
MECDASLSSPTWISWKHRHLVARTRALCFRNREIRFGISSRRYHHHPRFKCTTRFFDTCALLPSIFPRSTVIVNTSIMIEKAMPTTCFPNPPRFRLLLCRPIQLSTYAHYYVHREAQTSLHESSSDPHNIGAHIRKQKSKFRWRLARRTYLLADNKRAPRVHWRGNAGVRMGSASCHHTILTWVNDDGASLLAEQRSHRGGKQASRWVDPGTCHDVSAALMAPRASLNPPTGMGSTEDSLLAAPTSVDFV